MGTIFSKEEDKSGERIEIKGDGTPVKIKTSPYGWGKLSYPVKSTTDQQLKTKKKKKWVDPTVNTKVSPLAVPTTTPTTTVANSTSGPGGQQKPHSRTQNGLVFIPKSPAAHRAKTDTSIVKIAATRSNPSLPIVSLRPQSSGKNLLNRKSIPNSSQMKITTAVGRGILPKYTFKTTLNNETRTSVTNTVKPKRSPINSRSATTGPAYYGQYRCVKCKKYWRSGLSRDGVSQLCPKCGTPTFPRR